MARQTNLNHDGVIHSMLRRDTKSHHAQLNQHPLLKGLTNREYPLGNYQKVLIAYTEIYQVLETEIENFLSTHKCSFNYSQRRKLPWLRQDLDFLNIHDFPAVNPKHNLPAIDNLSQLTGVLYVIEGSMLGGQHISKALSTFHGLTYDQGARYFNGYGESTLAFWEDFIAYMESVMQDNQAYELTKRAAYQTFDLFKLTLDKRLTL